MTGNQFFEYIKQRYERYPLAFHLPGWALYVVLPYQILPLTQVFSPHEITVLFGIKALNEALIIAFFYLNYHILTPDALRRGQLARLPLAGLGMSALLTATNALYYHYVIVADLPRFSAKLTQAGLTVPGQKEWLGTPIPLIITSLISLLLLTSVSTGFAMYRERTEREARHQQMVIEKKEAELSALKLQISPHFLFNTLNNMRWLARQKSDQTEEAIMRLSDMLRYMIYQADRGPVALAKETDYLTDYVTLQQLRLAPHNQLVFETDLDDDRVLIEPLLLIPFVENAVKYGLHHEHESAVVIRLRLKQGTLRFSTRNHLYVSKPTDDSGIGVQNVKRRLALHYPDRHTLAVGPHGGEFCVDLQIDLIER
ncbi:sensor histidine kinase [Fibrella aquatilis]|uniref:Histidine kinase n=1 Tax=Fibrella aquatilis TaxID=2817059 RepID=A0A939G7S5_9BACT|nr:histidine kinase [Fibrella aquatilis]MBO0931950.1 histidine kinase [Fibrella aquatilis]